MTKVQSGVLWIAIGLLTVLSLFLYKANSDLKIKDDDPYAGRKFSDDRVIVFLTNEESLLYKSYTTDDFIGVECVEVYDLTPSFSNNTRAMQEALKTMSENDPKYLEYTDRVNRFNSTWVVILKNPSRENVLEAIKKIEELDWVDHAMPNWFLSQIDRVE